MWTGLSTSGWTANASPSSYNCVKGAVRHILHHWGVQPLPCDYIKQ